MFFRSKSSAPLRLGAGAFRCAFFLPICAALYVSMVCRSDPKQASPKSVRALVRSCCCYARRCAVLGVERVPVSRRLESRERE
ncbi:hypothetical protein K438DRAFT_1801868 [Mycena galopus ATCC 62051]|nr:hypothetical protein K438DRAFT_1801868 [Mycena galopus ATCC 62051]